nr:Smr/MutS family protein [Acuticoccus mangrovi]
MSARERALWDLVARTVKPLKPEKAAKEVVPPAVPTADAAPENPAPAPTPPAPPAAKPIKRLPPPTGDIDRKTRRKLARGSVRIDGRIDLHGMTQEEAHRALAGFIERSAARRHKVVLVITGKGSGGEGRGILRKSVPHWLTGRELTPHVVSFGPAHPNHGGDGALYVRLRSRG